MCIIFFSSLFIELIYCSLNITSSCLRGLRGSSIAVIINIHKGNFQSKVINAFIAQFISPFWYKSYVYMLFTYVCVLVTTTIHQIKALIFFVPFLVSVYAVYKDMNKFMELLPR